MQALRFLVVGAGNTLVGLAVIFLLMRSGVGDVLANLGGYVVGFVLSFFANGRWTFRKAVLTRGDLLRFGFVILAAYVANLAAMITARDMLGLGSEVAQTFGVATYAVIGYLGARWFAFRVRDHGNI